MLCFCAPARAHIALPAHTLPHQKFRTDRDCSDVRCGGAAEPRPAWHSHGARGVGAWRARQPRAGGGRPRLPSCGGSGADSDPAPKTRTRRGGFHSLQLAGCTAPPRCASLSIGLLGACSLLLAGLLLPGWWLDRPGLHFTTRELTRCPVADEQR
jgi:hypothetical protein